MEELLQKHRLEKKNVQAQITQLKHVSKNDKKRKKEVLEEIDQLEKELRDRHESELKSIESVSSPENGIIADLVDKEDEESSATQKMSKAGKRREKKTAQSKNFEKAYLEDEISARTGKRQLEIESINAQLDVLGLVLEEVPADGDCLFSSVAHQLQLCNIQLPHPKLREMTVATMRTHKLEFLPFLIDPHSGELLDDEKFEAYCYKMGKLNIWGGQPEIRALSLALQRPIEVFQADASKMTIGDEFAGIPPLRICYHHHFYRLGEHYNSCRPAPAVQ